jgi:endogenous inhibitor of DNA gyrase (YacG/DUF329 family)
MQRLTIEDEDIIRQYSTIKNWKSDGEVANILSIKHPEYVGSFRRHNNINLSKIGKICEKCKSVFYPTEGKQKRCEKCKQPTWYKHVCKRCGHSFSNHHHVSFYCSRFCVRNHKRYTGKCKICGGIFTSAHKIQKYCSLKCRHKASKRPSIKRICLKCGKEFVITKKSYLRKYCSEKCRYDREKHMKICKYCGKPFSSNGSHNKTVCCSSSCSMKYRLKNLNLDEIICKTCGKTFKPHTERHIFCSKTCSSIYYSTLNPSHKGQNKRTVTRFLIGKHPEWISEYKEWLEEFGHVSIKSLNRTEVR